MTLIEIYRGIEIYEKSDMVGGKYYYAPNLTTVKATVNFTTKIQMMKQFIDEELGGLENKVIKNQEPCKKKKLDKIKAMLIIANAQKQTQKNFDRKEIRTYFCDECNSYHTTSKK
jgi:hypothetical protein